MSQLVEPITLDGPSKLGAQHFQPSAFYTPSAGLVVDDHNGLDQSRI